jgi:hypothetical protein
LVVPGIWGLVAWSKRPSDAQLDAWIERALEEIQNRALLKTGMDPSEMIADPITLIGPDITAMRLSYRKGKNNVLRFNPIRVTIINFAQHQFFVYGCVLDLTTDFAYNETSDEYFYQDVVSVSTMTTDLTVQLRDRNIQLTMSLVVQLRDRTIQWCVADRLLLEKAFQVIRKMLREAKGSTPVR